MFLFHGCVLRFHVTLPGCMCVCAHYWRKKPTKKDVSKKTNFATGGALPNIGYLIENSHEKSAQEEVLNEKKMARL